jgi:hypothetical protein
MVDSVAGECVVKTDCKGVSSLQALQWMQTVTMAMITVYRGVRTPLAGQIEQTNACVICQHQLLDALHEQLRRSQQVVRE